MQLDKLNKNYTNGKKNNFKLMELELLASIIEIIKQPITLINCFIFSEIPNKIIHKIPFFFFLSAFPFCR